MTVSVKILPPELIRRNEEIREVSFLKAPTLRSWGCVVVVLCVADWSVSSARRSAQGGWGRAPASRAWWNVWLSRWVSFCSVGSILQSALCHSSHTPWCNTQEQIPLVINSTSYWFSNPSLHLSVRFFTCKYLQSKPSHPEEAEGNCPP